MFNIHGEDIFRIKSFKHNNKLHRVWETNIILHKNENELIGMNNQTVVIEPDDKKWVTQEPALFYFHKQYWFNIVHIFHNERPYYYCNISSPYTYNHPDLSYVDYDLDIIVHRDGTYELLDVGEFAVNKNVMNYGEEIETHIKENVAILKQWIINKKGPFKEGFIDYWFNYGIEYFK